MADHGDASRQVEKGIENADYVIAVLDGLKPNVLYELGLARGRDKSAILLTCRNSPEGGVPFDLHTLQRIEYANVDGEQRHSQCSRGDEGAVSFERKENDDARQS